MNHTSSSHYFISILHFLNQHGVDSEQALQAIGLANLQLDEHEQRIDLHYYSQLLAYAEQVLELPLVGFYLGQDIKSADFGVLGYLVESSRDLATAIESLLKYDALVADIGQANFSVNNQLARISWQPHQPSNRQVILRNITAWVATARQLTGPNLTPSKVYFADTWSKSEQEQLSHWFQCPLAVASNDNAIEFPADYLSLQFSSANAELFVSLEQVSKQQLASFQQGQSISLRLQSLLMSKTDLLDCTLSSIATSFNLSVRQLQRKLADEQSNFAQLLEQERKRRVAQFLGKKTMGQLAEICGFAEQSSFNKAFARWYQCSPSLYLKSSKLSALSSKLKTDS